MAQARGVTDNHSSHSRPSVGATGAAVAGAFVGFVVGISMLRGSTGEVVAEPGPDPKNSSSRTHGIWPLLKRTYAEFAEDRVPAVAAGITFFLLLALFPGIAAVVSLYRLIGDPAAIIKDLNYLSAIMPGGAIELLSQEVKRLTSQPATTLGVSFAVGFGIALWSASGGIKALIDGLNIAFEVTERRSFVRLSLTALLFTVIGICFLIAVLLLATVLPDAIGRFALGERMQFISQVLLWPVAYSLCVLLLALVYRFAPSRPFVKWRWITWGSAFASAAWIMGTVLFSWYVQNFGSYDKTYGALGSAIGFLTWIWLSLTILLTGAELNCELDRSEPAPVTPTGN